MTNQTIIAFMAILLTACAGPTVSPPPAAAGFVVDTLSETDGGIQGCITTLGRVGATPPATLFVEDGVDAGAIGFIRIDGSLIKVDLIGTAPEEKSGVRTFASADKSVRVVETYIVGDAHEESDSVELSGTLAVTYKGATQTIPVDGGTAC